MSTIGWLFIMAAVYLVRAVLKGQVFDPEGKFVLVENAEKTVTGLITGDSKLLADPAGGSGLLKRIEVVEPSASETGAEGGTPSFRSSESGPVPAQWAKNPRSVEAALAWADKQRTDGTSGWYHRCQAFVERCYGVGPSGIMTAYDTWRRMPSNMKHSGVSDLPAGCLLIYKPTPSNYAGHIALYAGQGMVYSNDIKRNGKIDRVKVSDLTGGIWNLPYQGWTPPYFPGSPVSKRTG